MAELRTSILVNLAGNLQQRARRFQSSLQGFSTAGQRHLGMLNRSATLASRGIDRLGNRYTAVLSGAAGVGAVRQLTRLEDQITRLGIQSNTSAERMEALKREVFDVARLPDIRVNPTQILEAIGEIIERTGDMEFALSNLHTIGATISATGAGGGAIGGLMAELQKQGMSPDQVIETIDTLNRQGKQGAFTLENLAALGPRLLSTYAALGRTGPQAIRELGAAMQTIMRGTGEANRAATAFEALITSLQDPSIRRALQAGGIEVFDTEALKEGRELMRPINEIMKEIVLRAGDKTSILNRIFGDQAVRALRDMSAELGKTGVLEFTDRLIQIQGDGTQTMEDSARAANTASGAMRGLATAWQSFADDNLTKRIQSVAEFINSLEQETVDRWLRIGGVFAAVVGGAVAVNTLGKAAGGLVRGGRFILGRGAAGGLAGGIAGAARSAAPIPVWVTNWGAVPPGAARGAGSAAGGAAAGAGASRAARLARFGATRMLPVAGAGAAGFGAGTIIDQQVLQKTETGLKARDTIGESIAKTLAFFGNDKAQSATERMDRAAASMERAASRMENSESRIQLDVDDRRVRVKRLESRGQEVDVDAGPLGVGEG